MQKMLYKIFYCCAIVALLQATACKKDDIDLPIDRTAQPRTIGQFIENNYNFGLLRAALKKTGLTDSLNAPNAGTFFAPDDNAFNRSGIFSVAEIEQLDTDSLREGLLNHMLPQRFFISGFPRQMGNAFLTKGGRTMYISIGPNSGDYRGVEFSSLTINGVALLKNVGTERNIALINGVVHVPFRLMKYEAGTVQDYLAGNKDLSIFVEAMKRFNFWDGLKDRNPVTVFAPKNKAFENAGITLDSVMRMSPDQYDPVLFGIYHLNLSSKRIFTSDGWLIGGTLYREQGLRLGAFSLLPQYGLNFFNSAQNDEMEINLMEQTGENLWDPNPYGAATTYYDNLYYRDDFEPGPNDNIFVPNTDHTTQNGVVHVIDDVLFVPTFFKK